MQLPPMVQMMSCLRNQLASLMWRATPKAEKVFSLSNRRLAYKKIRLLAGFKFDDSSLCWDICIAGRPALELNRAS